MKTAVVIPGFFEQAASGKLAWRYQPLLTDLKTAGYRVRIITISWERRVIFDWLEEAERQMVGINPASTVVIGFSYGAMIACGLAARHAFKKVILCSLSPYWAEDVPHLKQWWMDTVGKRRIQAFTSYHFADIVKGYKAAETQVFLGSIEYNTRKYPVMGKRGELAGKLLPNARFKLVPGAGHNIAHPNYRQAIKDQL